MYNAVLHECRDYEYDKVKEIIKKSIDELGGIGKFVNKGERVLIKPNLIMMKAPDKAATTHPSVVRAVAELVAEAGGKTVIAESPGGPFNERMLKSIYSACGITDAAEKSGAELNYNTATKEVSYPEGKLLKRITVIDELTKADKVINISKLKTHGMMRMTAAVKNLFGTIPGTMKAEYHLNRSNPDDFAEALIDICRYAKPVLNIVDAVVGMEGNGPTGGSPREISALLASDNPFALDMMCAYIINVPYTDIPVCVRAVERGLSPKSIDEINIIGDDISKFVITDFKAPKAILVNVTENLPKPVYKAVNNILQPYPVFNKDKCVGCGRCAENCPPSALKMKDKRPSFDKSKCIRCFCCQELCPAVAIDIKRPLFYRIFSSL